MTRTVEGVRDPHQISPEHENVVVRSNILPTGFDDIICPVDDEGYVRWPEDNLYAGEIVPWHSYTIMESDVDPETWGDQYHHPRDCPEGGGLRETCEDCTPAAEREGGDE